MSTFYLLPPRAVLGDRLADVLAVLLPGTNWDVAQRARLADVLLEVIEDCPDVFVVPREDLPVGEPAQSALIEGYGAARGDEVVEVRATARAGEFTSRRWAIQGAVAVPAQ
jgi:hypothetical protein